MNNHTPVKANALMSVQHGHVTIPIHQSQSGKSPLYQVRYHPPGGRRHVRSFRDLAQARMFATTVVTAVAVGKANSLAILLRMTPAAIHAATQIALKLQPFVDAHGVPLDKAINEYCEAKEFLQGEDLLQFLRETLDQPWRKRQHTPFLTAVATFLAEKAASGRRKSTCDRYKYVLKAAGSALGDPPLRDVTQGQLAQLVHRSSRSPRTNRSYRSALGTFYQWLEANDYLRPGQSFARAALQCAIVQQPAPAVLAITRNHKPKPTPEEAGAIGADE